MADDRADGKTVADLPLPEQPPEFPEEPSGGEIAAAWAALGVKAATAAEDDDDGSDDSAGGAGAGGAGAGAVASAEAAALAMASAPKILDLTSKLDTLAIDQNTLQRMPKTVIRRLDGLKLLHGEYQRIHAQLVAERKALELKYLKKFRPLLMQRTEIVNKRLDPSDIDIHAEEEGVPVKLPPPPPEGSDEEDDSDDLDIPGTPGVPGFWLQAMSNNEVIAQIITERDEDALMYLIDIRCEPVGDFQGFKVVFHFAPNRYFTNSELEKVFHISNMYHGTEPSLSEISGSEIKWRRGKKLTVMKVKQKSRVKDKGRRRMITREKPCPSFFGFFSGPLLSGDGATEQDDREELLNQIDADFEIGMTFRDKIVPSAYAWYTGEAVDSDSEDEDAGDDDDEPDYGGAVMVTRGDANDSSDEEVSRDEIRAALAKAFMGQVPAEPAPTGRRGKRRAAGGDDGDDDDDDDDDDAGRGGKRGDDDEDGGDDDAAPPPVERPAECKTQ